MRALWTGEIGFGLVAIPVKLYAATRDLAPRFHYLHRRCGTRLETVRRCPRCKVDVEWKDVGRGYEVSKGRYALFTANELAELDAATAAEGIELVQFIDAESIDPVFVEKSYWVGPGGKSARGYSLLRDALAHSNRLALARVKLRTRTRLAALRPRDGRFALDVLRFADELVASKEIETAETGKQASSREMQLAKNLIEQMSGDFEPGKHPDEYRRAVLEAVEAKVDAKQLAEDTVEHEAKGEGRGGGKVIDLSEMLTRSLAAAPKGGGRAKREPSHARASHKRVAAKRTTSARKRRRAA